MGTYIPFGLIKNYARSVKSLSSIVSRKPSVFHTRVCLIYCMLHRLDARVFGKRSTLQKNGFALRELQFKSRIHFSLGYFCVLIPFGVLK